jgi:hypothetical protein
VRIVGLVGDLLDQSRLESGLPGIVFGGDPDACSGADVVLVDLARFGDQISAIRAIAPAAKIVGFGAHVDEAALAAARTEGADLALPRSRMFRDPAGVVAALHDSGDDPEPAHRADPGGADHREHG